MNLIDYGPWTITVPFFTHEHISAFKGATLPSRPEIGTLYFILHGQIKAMYSRMHKDHDWVAAQSGPSDQALLDRVLAQDIVNYETY